MTPVLPPGGTRSVARDAVRASISAAALELFAARGFDTVTIDQVAEAAGTSTRSVHRHFPTKEDLVVGDHSLWGEGLADAVAARPDGEPIWESLRHGFQVLTQPPYGDPTPRGRRRIGVIVGAPSLRARLAEKHQGLAQRLLPTVTARLPAHGDELTAPTLVRCATACFEAALAAWALPADRAEGAENAADLPQLLDQAFGVLAPTP